MIGKRVYPDENGYMHFDEGDYGRDPSGEWWARAPGLRAAGALSNHEVVEHEDGTITVAPSILMEAETSFHGYLERGVWRAV